MRQAQMGVVTYLKSLDQASLRAFRRMALGEERDDSDDEDPEEQDDDGDGYT